MDCDIIATATFGLEAVVAQELKELGYSNLEVEHGRVEFRGSPRDICLANTWLRSADRVRWKLAEFEAKTFDELFEGVKKIPWGDILPKKARFPVEGKSVKSQLSSVPACQSITKKAIVDSMSEKTGIRRFEETGELYKIEVALLKDRVTISVDSTGPGLHKRGYRPTGSPAPLKETLAAALLQIARWKADIPLIDPFCGSGTIPIEAAMIGTNLAPGLKRNFVSEEWPQMGEKCWKEVREEALSKVETGNDFYIMGYDYDPRAIKLARQNASRAGVEDVVHFQEQELEELNSRKKYGKIICNPPYGERMEEVKTAENLYNKMGKTLKKLDTWSFYILTAHPGFERIFGEKASKKRKLFNGNIRVDYYQFFGPSPPRR